jgi:hypothetical protein
MSGPIKLHMDGNAGRNYRDGLGAISVGCPWIRLVRDWKLWGGIGHWSM